MPCYTPPPTAEEEYVHWEARLRHNSPTADALCAVMKWLDDAGIDQGMVPTVAVKWWREHKERDRLKAEAEAKVAREKAERKAALEKLTPAERKALGLK